VLLTDEVVPGSEALGSPRIVLNRPGMLGGIQYAPGRWRVMTTLRKDAPDAAAYDESAHAERLRLIFGDGVTSTTGWQSLFRIHRRHAMRFVVGRFALAGDAAHLNSPAGGQGMNSGIQDAANLAWKFAYALDGGDGAVLLESYDLERREMIADTVERFTDRITHAAIGMPSRWPHLRKPSARREYSVSCAVPSVCCRAVIPSRR
jgi:2-polyprenyl-6-methoxyphenol hydroxylase-like FAD-dependent oxidoreductase